MISTQNKSFDLSLAHAEKQQSLTRQQIKGQAQVEQYRPPSTGILDNIKKAKI